MGISDMHLLSSGATAYVIPVRHFHNTVPRRIRINYRVCCLTNLYLQHLTTIEYKYQSYSFFTLKRNTWWKGKCPNCLVNCFHLNVLVPLKEVYLKKKASIKIRWMHYHLCSNSAYMPVAASAISKKEQVCKLEYGKG